VAHPAPSTFQVAAWTSRFRPPPLRARCLRHHHAGRLDVVGRPAALWRDGQPRQTANDLGLLVLTCTLRSSLSCWKPGVRRTGRRPHSGSGPNGRRTFDQAGEQRVQPFRPPLRSTAWELWGGHLGWSSATIGRRGPGSGSPATEIDLPASAERAVRWAGHVDDRFRYVIKGGRNLEGKAGTGDVHCPSHSGVLPGSGHAYPH